jgi:hypothetical protein
MMLTRRALLQTLGVASTALITSRFVPALLAQQSVDADVRLLDSRIKEVLGDAAIGLDIRRINWALGEPDFSIQHNADAYFPVASCFKALVVLYYLAMTPQDQWAIDERSPAYRVAVFSNNPLTGELLQSTSAHYPGNANPIVKFNNWVREALAIPSGLVSWDWPGSPTIGWTDRRYSATLTNHVTYRGAPYLVDNIYQPMDLAAFWAYLLKIRPLYGWRQAQEAVQTTLELFSIPATAYQSPIERAWGAYVGKDGVIPAADTPIGARVTNDAGIILVGQTPYVVSAMSLDGEYFFVERLRQVLALVEEYESSRRP